MARNTSFYYSFLVLPEAKRQAITAVWDFCRAVDDAVDLEPDRVRARAAIESWRAEVARLFSNQTPATPEGQALRPFVASFRLPREQFDALIDGVAMDLDTVTYPTFESLEPYCHRVASAVGLICAEIFGYEHVEARDYARDLGVALQLTNILRDVAVDYRQGRVYLPIEDLARFGCTPDDIGREVARAGPGVANDRLRAVLDHQASRAKVYFARAVRALPPGDRRNFLPAEIMRVIYSDLLRRIVDADFDIFRGVIRVPRPVQARLALGAWWRGRRDR